ncbi:MAG: hypothetical protein FWB98_05890 [Defluviitaleaceae bacterium]|nr:hypothetical protein [Defluviitaleaceae bacterium]
MKNTIDTSVIPEPFYRYFKPQPEPTAQPAQSQPKQPTQPKPTQNDLVFLMAALMLCEE